MKKTLQIVLGIAITAACLAWVFSGLDLAALKDGFVKTNWLFAAPMVAITLFSFFWRAVRWRVLLSATKDVPAARLYGPVMIGFGFNNVFPFRAGEVARAYALNKQEGVPFGAGFSTIVLERLVDAITLLVLLATMGLYAPIRDIDPPFAIGKFTIDAAGLQAFANAISVAAAVLTVGAISFLFPALTRLYIAIIGALPLLPGGLKEKLAGFVESFATGFQSIKSPKALALIAFHSAVIWATVALSFWVMSFGVPGAQLTVGQSFAFLVVTCIAVAAPSSPGFWGVYELGGKAALIVLGVVPNTEAGGSTAVAFTIVVHFLQWISLTAVGFWFARKLSISRADAGG